MFKSDFRLQKYQEMMQSARKTYPTLSQNQKNSSFWEKLGNVWAKKTCAEGKNAVTLQEKRWMEI